MPAAPRANTMGPMRATKNTPAFTIVAACIKADTAVGPVIASSSHSLRGNCADLPTAPPNNSTNAGTSIPAASMFTAHWVLSSISRKPNVPAYMNISSMPASIITSPTLVMMKAFIPACVGE